MSHILFCLCGGLQAEYIIVGMEGDYISFEELKSYKGFQIVQLNVRSIYHKVGAISKELDESRIGVLGITETWLNDSTPSSLVNIDGYVLLRNDRPRCRGGGTCLYVKDDLEYEIPDDIVNNRDIEMQSVTIMGRNDFQRHKHIVVILIYRPPNGNSNRACELLREYIKGIAEYEKKEIVIMGDLNWDMNDIEGIGKKLVADIADEFDLTQQIKQPTRVTQRCSTLIDIILTNMKNIAYSGCLSYQISDHCPVYIV